MSDWTQADAMACPDDDELLLASEGELPPRRLEVVRDHVRRCADCRERMARTDRVVGAYGQALADMPSEVAVHRPDVQRTTFRETLHSEAVRGQHVRQARATRVTARQWLPVAAAVPILVVGLMFSSRYTQSVKADELLTRAAQREQAVPASLMRRVQIRVGSPSARASRAIVREIGAGPQASRLATATGDSEEARLAARLAAHHFDLADPLSITHFQAWRASLARKRDAVQERRDARLVALTTTTDEGELRRAEIVVRESDYRPIQQTLSFHDGGDVVMEEVAAWVVEAPPVTPKIVAPVSSAPARTVARAEPAPKAVAERAVEAPLTIGLERWRARTFGGGAAADAFGPQLSDMVDRLRAQAHRLSALGEPAASRPVVEDYGAFMRELEAVDRQLALFLGSSTRPLSSAVPPADLGSRGAAIAARADALRGAVRVLLAHDDVPLPTDMASGDAEPEPLAAVRRALDALWAAATEK